jgi:hypothetical protein
VAVPDGAVIELSPLTALEPADLRRHGLPTSVGDGTVL